MVANRKLPIKIKDVFSTRVDARILSINKDDWGTNFRTSARRPSETELSQKIRMQMSHEEIDSLYCEEEPSIETAHLPKQSE